MRQRSPDFNTGTHEASHLAEHEPTPLPDEGQEIHAVVVRADEEVGLPVSETGLSERGGSVLAAALLSEADQDHCTARRGARPD
jgi:hypothetical protein